MIPIAAAVPFLKMGAAYLLECLKLLLDPKVWLLLALAASYGFMKGCEHEADRFKSFRDGVETIGKKAEEFRLRKNEEYRQAKLTMEKAHAEELKRRSDRYAALYARYNDGLHFSPSGSIVPGDPTGPGRTVPTGQVLCYDRNRLNAETRLALGAHGQELREIAAELIDLVREGESGLDTAVWFGRWAEAVGSCRPTQ